MSFTIAIDIGGTCTDCAAMDDQGRLHIAKAFSTPPDFSEGIIDALRLVADEVGIELEQLMYETQLFLHSTSVAENAIINGHLAVAGLITTKGFEHSLAATRGGYGRWSGLTELEKRDPIHTDKPPPIIPADLIRGIEGRTGSEQERLVDMDDDDVQSAIAALTSEGIQSLAVSLLWSTLNPDVEQRVADIAIRHQRDLFVSLSHQIAPVIGEYERTSTTALNARLGPVVRDYLNNLMTRLQRLGFEGTVLVMQAHGGLLPVSDAEARPVGMIESGPVSGLIGSQQLGRDLGIHNIIATDMGGTTFKVGVVRDGRIDYERNSMVLRYHFASPKLDVTSLGLAGGSIISVDRRSGAPSIGPRSAGSYPGPVCYGNGGDEPTVTDVDAILGYLNSDFFLGGSRALDIERARELFEERVAHPLGMTLDQAAPRIYRLANSLIGDMLHKVTVQRGLDPRSFTLVSIGGTAGMHVTCYASLLDVHQVVIPRSASVHSALGLLGSDIVHQEQSTRSVSLPVDPAQIQALFEPLVQRAKARLREEGFSSEMTAISRSIDMRYRRQTNIITVPVDEESEFDEPLLDKVIDRFEELYEQRYGKDSGFRDAGIECVSFRVRGTGFVEHPSIEPAWDRGTDPRGALVQRVRAWVDDHGSFEEVPGYSFELLCPGNVVPGPAVIWSPITTVVLRDVDTARVDAAANLLVYRKQRNGR